MRCRVWDKNNPFGKDRLEKRIDEVDDVNEFDIDLEIIKLNNPGCYDKACAILTEAKKYKNTNRHNY